MVRGVARLRHTSRLMFSLIGLGLLVPAALVAVVTRGGAADPLDQAFADYWSADSARGREKVVDRLLRASTDFDRLRARLKAGRPYRPEKPGTIRMAIAAGGALFPDTVVVPAGYDPAKRWPLRVQLHGGVGRAAPEEGFPDVELHGGAGRAARDDRLPRRTRALEGEPAIYALPAAWSGVEWWHDIQLANVGQLVDAIKQRYNVDESRVYVTGASDGGTGAYYMVLRDATRWSAALPLVSSPKVLANPRLDKDGALFASNLLNRPIFAVNAIDDPLYPAAIVRQWTDLFARDGVDIALQTVPGGHGVDWWPDERDAFAAFALGHPRAAHPAHLTWTTDQTDRANRIQWLTIDELGDTPSDQPLPPVGDYTDAHGSARTFFPPAARAGRADVWRDGNRFTAKTHGVRAFTLLLSPDVVDFSKPVIVTVNGAEVTAGVVAKSAATLLKWAARDDDRTMLYGAELRVQVPRSVP